VALIGNILASSYKYYASKKKVDPFFQAILIVAITFSLSLLLGLLVINEFLIPGIFIFLSRNKVLVVFCYVAILFLTLRYFKRDRMHRYIEQFEQLSLNQRRSWAIITATSVSSAINILFNFIDQTPCIKTAANIAFAKCGQTMELQQQQHCRFSLGLERLLISLVGISKFTFHNYHFRRPDPASNIHTSQMQTVTSNVFKT
jgi:hypothetical protein